MDIVALVGFIGSGKDTVGQYLVEHYGFKDLAFADALKDAVAVMFSWDRQMLEGQTKESREWRNQVDTWWANRLSIPHLTPRWALQNFGTDIIRRNFHDDFWTASVERRIDLLGENAKVVITDGRFPVPELSMVRGRGGSVIRVKRGAEPEWYGDAYVANMNDLHADDRLQTEIKQARCRMKNRDIHVSEWAWIGYNFDHIISNDGSLEDLYENVDRVLSQTDSASWEYGGYRGSVRIR